MTLGYSESDHQPPQVAIPGALRLTDQESQGLMRAPQNPHSPRLGSRSPQESHGRNDTLRYTCYAC